MTKETKLLILAAETLPAGDAPELIRILPLGQVKSEKGDFLVDAESYQLMKAQMERRKLDLPIDYEHQTLKDVQAPAAAWIKELILGDDAIRARVEWTPRGRDYVASGEYRYTSPVVRIRKTDGKVIGLHSAALTNTPAIDNMYTIAGKAMGEDEEDDSMELVKALAALLGLPETATEDAVTAAVKTLAEQTAPVVANKTVADLLGLDEAKAKTEDYCAAILALKTAGPSEDYLALKARLDKRDAEDAVAAAAAAGKITGATREWAMTYALKDPAGFKAFCEKAPAVVPVGELDLVTPAKTSATPAAVEDAVRMVCKQMGVSADEALKALKEE